MYGVTEGTHCIQFLQCFAKVNVIVSIFLLPQKYIPVSRIKRLQGTPARSVSGRKPWDYSQAFQSQRSDTQRSEMDGVCVCVCVSVYLGFDQIPLLLLLLLQSQSDCLIVKPTQLLYRRLWYLLHNPAYFHSRPRPFTANPRGR